MEPYLGQKVVTKKVENIIDLTSNYGYRFKPNWCYAARLTLQNTVF
ncbi:DUF3078 domain-containing protein [Bacteroidetes bacterium endosymbiont of Geopemphigus sp.]|nr:DUF3078 domain-containing protein [Bacteroidetes bacterium endosymbiont of Geopemphigus sp.]